LSENNKDDSGPCIGVPATSFFLKAGLPPAKTADLEARMERMEEKLDKLIARVDLVFGPYVLMDGKFKYIK
jgi:hypothetical protein